MNKQNNYNSLTKTLHHVEESKCKLVYEVGTLISPDGKVIKEYCGETHSINIPYEDRPLFEGNIFTHNHPSGRCFTQRDIIEFIDCGAMEMRVSTPQGTYFSLKESDGEINRSVGRIMREEKIGNSINATEIIRDGIIEGKYHSNIMEKAKEYEFLVYDIMADEVDKWLTENAGEFGYIYAKGVL